MHEQSIDKLTAVWLLPVVPPIVASGVGGNLCSVIPKAAVSPTLIASYVSWGIGVPFSMSLLVLYIHRLTVYNVFLFLSFLIQLPPSEISVSAFLPIGSLGQGGAAIIQLGVVARNIEFISPQISQTLHGIGIFAGLIMWSYALLWITLAIATMAARFPRIPFSMAWWGFTFPLGILRNLPLLTWRNICIMLGRTGERIDDAILQHYGNHCDRLRCAALGYGGDSHSR